MKTIKNHLASALVVIFFLFIAFGSDDTEITETETKTKTETKKEIETQEVNNQPEIQQEQTIEGIYEGKEKCICCGEHANKYGNPYEIRITLKSKDEVSVYNLSYQKREIIGKINDNVIIIDEKNSGNGTQFFQGKIEIIDNNTLKLKYKWWDPGYSLTEVANECEGEFTRL